MRLNSLGTLRILFWHFPRVGMLRLICLWCFYLVDQKYFREFMGEMGCQLRLMLSETKVTNGKQFGDIWSNISILPSWLRSRPWTLLYVVWRQCIGKIPVKCSWIEQNIELIWRFDAKYTCLFIVCYVNLKAKYSLLFCYNLTI